MKDKRSCKNCKYYEKDFNGKECCIVEVIKYSGSPEELSIFDFCDDYEELEK